MSKITLEQKVHAVRLVKHGAPVKIVAEELGVTPRAVYVWLKKYPEVGIMAKPEVIGYGVKPLAKPQGIFGRFLKYLGFGSSV